MAQIGLLKGFRDHFRIKRWMGNGDDLAFSLILI